MHVYVSLFSHAFIHLFIPWVAHTRSRGNGKWAFGIPGKTCVPTGPVTEARSKGAYHPAAVPCLHRAARPTCRCRRPAARRRLLRCITKKKKINCPCTLYIYCVYIYVRHVTCIAVWMGVGGCRVMRRNLIKIQSNLCLGSAPWITNNIQNGFGKRWGS